MSVIKTLLSFFGWSAKAKVEEVKSNDNQEMKKFLIVGLGNIGAEYVNTRHNIGFKILDYFANQESISFQTQKLGEVAEFKIKGRTVLLLKPNTYMNLSGKALKYWMNYLQIPIEQVFVIVDDLALPFGTLRLRKKGSDAGHNGLKNIQEVLQTQDYARLRFGISADFSEGKQIDYVLGKWNEEELKTLQDRIDVFAKACLSFVFAGVNNTMNIFNGK